MQNSLMRLFNTGTYCLFSCCKSVVQNTALKSLFSTSSIYNKDDKKVSKWLSYNDKIYPPRDPSEEQRPAYVCHEILRAKYSPDKMWYTAHFIRGMSVDEAIKQLKCLKYKGATIALQAINEAIEKAVKEHNVEFRSNLWVAESFCSKGLVVKGLRRCGKGRITKIRYRYVNYYIRLEEGQPPEDYTGLKILKSGPYLLDKWKGEIRRRKIINSL